MESLPLYIYIVFGATVLLAISIFYFATAKSGLVLSFISVWIIAQALISITGFYTITQASPPRLPLLILPTLILIITLFASTKGRTFMDGLDIRWLTLLHIIRIPVEIVLLLLSLHHAVPQLMTFEGRNFDILSGLSAPFIYYFGFVKMKMGRLTIIIWNMICIGLLFNIVANALLSAPTPFQLFAFDQPNVAILYFPFTLLPGFLVPLVLFSHLASIRLLLSSQKF